MFSPPRPSTLIYHRGVVSTLLTQREMGKLSLGKAAELAGIDKIDFMKLLSEHKISVYNYPPEELEEDLADIQSAREDRKLKR
jgi:predicted HTH domain antitoxin